MITCTIKMLNQQYFAHVSTIVTCDNPASVYEDVFAIKSLQCDSWSYLVHILSGSPTEPLCIWRLQVPRRLRGKDAGRQTILSMDPHYYLRHRAGKLGRCN